MDGDGAPYQRHTGDSSDTPTELAQASAGEAVGRIETANGNATVTRTDGAKVKVEVGLEIFQGDVVETIGESSVGILFADNSTFSLADDGRMTIDEMVYDPGAQEGAAALSVASGVFTFISGQIAKTGVDAMNINTPTATIGIRGTSLAANVGGKGGDVFTLLKDPEVPASAASTTIKGQAGDDTLLAQAPAGGGSGEVTIANSVGVQTLNQPFATTQVSSGFSPPSRPVILPQAVVNRVYAAAVAVMQQTLAVVSGSAGATGAQAGEDATAPGEETQTGETGTEDGEPEAGADPEDQAIEDAAVEAFETALANGESLGGALNAAIEGAAAEVAGQIAALDQGELPNAGIDVIMDTLGDPDVGRLIAISGDDGDGDDAGPGDFAGGDFGDFGDVFDDGFLGDADFGPDPFGDVFDDIFQEIFFDIFEDTLEFIEGEIIDDIDDIVDDFEEQAAANPSETISFSTSASETLTSGLNEIFLGADGVNNQLYLYEAAEAGDIFEGGTLNDTVTFNTDGVDHTFRVFEVERVNMSDVGAGGVFNLNHASAGALSISLTPTGDINITGTADGSTDETLDQSFTLISDGSIGDTNSLSISGSGGNDTLTLDSGTHMIAGMAGIEYFHMSNTVTTLQSSVSGVTIDASSGSSLTLDGVGNSVTVTASASMTTLSGSSGTDSLTVSSSATVTNISDIEAITGSGATLIGLANGGQTVTSLSGSMTTFTGGTGDDTVTSNSATITTLLGGAGTDTFSFGGSSNTVSAMSGIETLNGGAGTDSVTLATAQSGLTVSGTIETLTGGSGSQDNITFASSGGSIGNVQNIATITGGTGTDVVSFADVTNHSITLLNIESVTGGTGNDLLTLGAAQSSGAFNLGNGQDRLTLANGSNTLSVSGIESIVGGTGADVITYTAAQSSGTVSLGAGTDQLVLADGGNTLTVLGLETVTGGTGADIITVGAAETGDTYSLGGGTDELILHNGTNSVTTVDVEVIDGGTGADTVVVSGSTAATFTGGGGADTFTGGTGADRFVFEGDSAANLGTDVMTNFSGATSFGGGSGDGDVIVLASNNLGIASLVYEEVSWDGSTSAINLSNANATVIVLHGTAGTLTDAITALVAGNAAGDATNGDAVILFNNSSSSNKLQMVHTDDVTNGGANINTLATFTNNSTATDTDDLSSSDFSVENFGLG